MSDRPISPLLPFTENGRVVGARLCDFETGSSKPRAAHIDWVEKYFTPTIKKHPGAWVDLIGYASRLGSASSNLELSKKRIASVESLIRKNHSSIKFNVRKSVGEAEAEESQFEDSNNDGYWRAVLIRWYGVPLVLPTPEYPPIPKPSTRKLVAPPGCWCIVGVDSVGLPIKPGISVSVVTLSLLNDKGEVWKVKGMGGGPGVGIDIGPETANKILQGFKEVLLKFGDLPNVIDKIKELKLTGPNETNGPILKQLTWKANLTIEDITRLKSFMIGTAEGQFVAAGVEVGLIQFGPPGPQIGPLILLGAEPWGFYSSLGLGTLKAAFGAGVTAYAITSVSKEA